MTPTTPPPTNMDHDPDRMDLGTAPGPFGVLGLAADPDLTDDQVHHAWRTRIRSLHPDRGGDPRSAALVTAAYQTLRSAVRRADALADLADEPGWSHSRERVWREPLPHRRRQTFQRTEPADATESTADIETDELLRRLDHLEREAAGRATAERARAEDLAGSDLADTADAVETVRPGREELDEIRARITAEREAQGLPATIDDDAILDKVITIMTRSVESRPAGSTRVGAPSGFSRASRPSAEAGNEQLHSPAEGEDERSFSPRATDGQDRTPPAAGLSGLPGVQQRVAWWFAELPSRIRYGRPLWLAGRVAVAAAVPLTAYLVEPDYPAWIALVVGALTWIACTARHDLAPRSLL